MSTLPEVKKKVEETKIVTVFDFFEKKRDIIAKALPNVITTDRLIGVLTMVLRSSPQLMECTQTSLIGAVIQTVQVGLTPGSLGHVYYVPFNNKQKDGSYRKEVQFIIGYRGLCELVNRSGKSIILSAECVYSNDHFHQEQGLVPVLRHVVATGDRGEFVGVYAIAKNLVANEKVFVYLSKEDVEKVREASKAGQKEFSPWVKWYDEMAKKTAVKRLCKLLPLSIEVQRQLSTDETIKPEIDRNMVEVPDATNWEDGEIVNEQKEPEAPSPQPKEPQPQAPQTQKASEPTKEKPQLKSPSTINLDKVKVGETAKNWIGLVVKITSRQVTGKDGSKKDITCYICEDPSGTTFCVEKWGKPHDGLMDGMLAIFKDILVNTFHNERTYMAKSVEVYTAEPEPEEA